MTVQQVVIKMMQDYPSLYRTRALALKRLFDSPSTRWVGGELVDGEASTEPRKDYLPYKAEDVAFPNPDKSPSSVIFARQQNAAAQFVHDNAALLSKDTNSGFDSREYHLTFEGRRFTDMPADVTPEWLEAAKELAFAVIAHQRDTQRPMDPKMQKHAEEQQDAAKKLCQQFLERFKAVPGPDPWVRAHRVKELYREALALGLLLTEADGSELKVSVL